MLQILDGLEQRGHRQRAVPAPVGAAPQESGGLGQPQHLQHVAGAVGHGDDVAAEGVGADLALHVRHDPEDVERAAGLRGQLHSLGEEMLALGDLAGEQGHPLVLAELVVGLGQVAPRGQDLRHGLGVPGGLLTHVQPGQEEAEGLHDAAQVLQLPVGDGLVAVAGEGGGDVLQVLEQLTLVGVSVVAFGPGDLAA